MNNKIIAGILIIILAVGAAATITAPTRWGQGYKLYSSYWDMMGAQVFNGTYSNMSIDQLNTSAYATATVFFNYSSTRTQVNYNRSINISGETYVFKNNTKGNRIVNLSANQSLSYACSQFVTEINTNSSNTTASTCVSNSTTITSKWLGTPSNSYAVTTNETNITVTASFTGGSNYSHTYFDLVENYDANASTGDLIFRSKNSAGALTERFRIKEYVAPGNGFVLSEVTIPTSRPTSPVNGSFVLNLTDNSTEVYADGAWHFSGNGTVK